MAFDDELRNIQRLQTQGMNSQAIKECSAIIEQVLEKFYRDIWANLNADEKQGLVSIERKFSRRKTPIETLGLGRWINFYEESRLPELVKKYLGVDLHFDFDKLGNINEIRNKCTHESYEASQSECQDTYDYTLRLLRITRLIEREPVGIRRVSVAEEKARPKSQVWGDKIRLLLASDPTFELQEVFEMDFGKFYDVLGKWEFVGAASSENIVHILLLEDDSSSYHDDIIENVYERVGELVKERICKNLPQVSGVKIKVSITHEIGYWGDSYAEIEL